MTAVTAWLGHPASLSRAARLRRSGTLAAVTGVAYALLALSSYEIFGALSIGVTFFPPAGLTFAAFVLLDRRDWPAVALAIVVGEISVDMAQGNGFWWSAAWAAANLAEPLVGATIARSLTTTFDLTSRRDAGAMTLGGILVGPIVGGTIGATTLAIANDLTWRSSFWHIWVGDALGVLVVAPVVLAFARPPRSASDRGWGVEAWLLGAIVGALGVAFLTTQNVPIGYAAIPVLGWPAVRFGPRGLALTAAAVAAFATAATAAGSGPWSALIGLDEQTRLGHQQAFLLAAIGGAWLLVIEASERVAAVRRHESAARAWQSDHEVALTLQQALMPLPLDTPTTPHAAGRYLPATSSLQVGGDWYEVVTADDGVVTLLVGDVVGHGLAAAAAMGRLSSAARALALTAPDPASLLAALDRVAALDDAQMATLVCVQLDGARGLRYSTAGHPPPLVRGPDARITVLDGARGAPLAAGFGPARTHETVPVAAGSLVVLYTDGLIERRGIPFDDRFSELVAVVRGVDPEDPTAAADAIVRQLLTDEEQTDDVAVLCFAIGTSHSPVPGARSRS